MPDGKEERQQRDAFDIDVDMFDRGWCTCCPSAMTMPVATLIAAVLGIITGVVLYELDVKDSFKECYGSTSSPEKQSCWYELFEYPGMLWVRALKCVVAPLIACMMLLIPSKLKALGPVGQKVAMLLLFTSFIAALEGLCWGNIIQPGDAMDDGEDTLKKFEKEPMKNYVSELESFLNIGKKAVPDNIVKAMGDLAVLGIITFFLTFGYYLEYDCPEEWRSPIINAGRGFLRASLNVLMMLMWFMPIAMFSLLSYNMMKTDLKYVANTVALYLTAQLVGQFVHLVGFYFLFFWLMTWRNPVRFYANIFRAPFTAFLTSSSAATLPVTLQANKMERGEDYFAKQVVEFVCPLGAALNMDGTSLGFPIAVLMTAQVGVKLSDQFPDAEDVSFGNQLLVAVLAMVCSLGTAPIPNAGLVYLTMLYEAADISNGELQGMGIAIFLLVDWIVDRAETAQNVSSDSFISAIIAYSPYFKDLKESAVAEMVANSETQMAPMDDGTKGDQRV